MTTPTDPWAREGWAPPFSAAEYGERWDRVRAEMARRDIDTLIVTSPPNLTYLTNYDSIWYDLTVVTAFVLHAAGGEPFLLDSGYHQMLAQVTAVAPEIVYHRGRGTRGSSATSKSGAGSKATSRSNAGPAPPADRCSRRSRANSGRPAPTSSTARGWSTTCGW